MHETYSYIHGCSLMIAPLLPLFVCFPLFSVHFPLRFSISTASASPFHPFSALHCHESIYQEVNNPFPVQYLCFPAFLLNKFFPLHHPLSRNCFARLASYHPLTDPFHHHRHPRYSLPKFALQLIMHYRCIEVIIFIVPPELSSHSAIIAQ